MSISEHSLSIFQTPAVSCLARRDLRTCLLANVLRLFSIRVFVAFDIYGVCVYKVFEDKAKKQYSLWIVQTPAVSCVVRRDLRTYLPMFRENSWLFELVCWLIVATVAGLHRHWPVCHYQCQSSPSEIHGCCQGQENNTAQTQTDKWLSFPSHFSSFFTV